MDRLTNLRRAQRYLHSGRMIEQILATLGLAFGMELIVLGHVTQLHGVAESLGRLFPAPMVVHGAVLAFIGLGLAYAAAQRHQAMVATLLIVNVSFWTATAMAGLFAACGATVIVCSSAAGLSIWRVLAVTRAGGTGHVVGGSHYDTRVRRSRDHGGDHRSEWHEGDVSGHVAYKRTEAA